MSTKELSGGVTITPMPPSNGAEVTITYKGDLVQQGANNIALHVAYGTPGHYFNNRTMDMQKRGNQYVSTFNIEASDTLNFYFTDQNGNSTDDNNGQQWSVPVDSDSLSYG